MKIRTLASLLITLVLTACNPSPSSLSSDSSSFSLPEESSSSLPIIITTAEPSSASSNNTDINSIYDGYYVDVPSWTNGDDLKQKLYDLSRKNYQPLNYTAPNYQTNINADHTKYDFEYLDVIYSGDDVYKNETNKGWQREHAFCASLMCGSLTANAVKQLGRATDFHNLFAAQASANGSRGNKNYGEADTQADSYVNRDTPEGQGYKFDADNFEPGNYDKGRVARAIFYMAMMYKNDEEDKVNGITMKGLRILEEPVSYTAGENGAFAIGNLSTLLKWNKMYPVDYLEMQHNLSVFKDVSPVDGHAQGNRNPFVDFPDLVDYVYGDKKNQDGSLASLFSNSSESKLQCGSSSTEESHYALKEAKRAYAPGENIASSDYNVVKVLKNYTYQTITTGITHSLANHTFSESDGEAVTATISVGQQNIQYRITLNPLASCSTGEIVLSTTGLSKSKPNQDQETTFNDIPFIFNFDTSYMQNISAGGITLGSGNNALTKLVIKTKNSYKVDAAYIKTFVNNTSSSFKLTIKVGDAVLLNQATVNNKDVAKVYGASTSSPLEGQVTYIFEGSNALKINSIAFNSII